MKLRHYQKEAVDAVERAWAEHSSTLVVMPTGVGKTVTFAEVIRRAQPARAMVLAHREELIFQAQDKIARLTGLDAQVEMGEYRADMRGLMGVPQVVVSTVQTHTAGGDGGGRMSKFDPADFGLLIIDECFPAGTLVDGRPIETIAAGDYVTAFDHSSGSIVRSRVTKTFRSRPHSLCQIRFNSGRVVTCTYGHPFYDPINCRYVPAIALSCGSAVVSITEGSDYVQDRMQGVRGCFPESVESQNVLRGVREKGTASSGASSRRNAVRGLWQNSAVPGSLRARICEEGPRVLFGRMLQIIQRNGQLPDHGEDEQEIRLSQNDREKPDDAARSSRQGVGDLADRGLEAGQALRKWGTDGAAKASCARFGLGDGTCSPNRDGTRERIPFSLQGGCRKCGIENCRGGGRREPLCLEPARRGLEEGSLLGVDRVESVTPQERVCDEGFGRLCPGGLVFNLEVERHHNYFANGVLVHNCHHAVSSSYRRCIDWYRGNPALRVLGVTATPDRADEEALGQVFDSVAYDYEVLDAIGHGWLVPVEQQVVHVSGLDFSRCRTTAGDLNGADLAEVMEAEQALHGIAAPAVEIAGGRRALVFAASVQQAERLAEIINRHRPGKAGWLCGKTEKDERRRILVDFAAGRLQFVVNVGVLTEGFDDSGVELVIMARPTKSRALYAQMAGRATRPAEAIACALNDAADAEERRAMIAASAKPHCLIVDFCGNSGRHKLMTSADALGGNVSDEAVELARRRIAEGGRPADVAAELQKAQRDVEEQKRREEARRAALTAKAKFSVQRVNPFDVFDIQPVKERGWDAGKRLSEKQAGLLRRQGVDPDALPYGQAKQILDEMFRRWDGGLATFGQAKVLKKNGLVAPMRKEEAKKAIDRIAQRQGWRKAGAA